MGINFLREKVFFRLFSFLGYSAFPSLITILVTQRCNFKCEGCSSNSPFITKNFNQNKNKELNLEEIKKIINQVAWFKPFIYLNGGEPTLRSDLLEIIAYIKSKKLICALTTNGSFLTKSLINQLIEVKLDFLSVSIDGPETAHDSYRGVKGAFAKASQGLSGLVNLKKELRIDYPHIRLASIIFPQNQEDTKYVIDLANKIGVDEIGLGLLMYYPQKIIGLQEKFMNKNKTGGKDPIGLKIKDNYKFNFSLANYQNFLAYAKQKSKIPIYFSYKGNQYQDYFNPQVFPSKKSFCLTPWNNLLIFPNGDLGFCQGFKFGHIDQGSILKQWNNQKIRRFRKLRSQTPFPACFRCNEGQKIKFA